MATADDTGLPPIQSTPDLQWTVRAWLTVPVMALLLACGAAQAADWKQVGDIDKYPDYPQYVDTSTITVSGQIRRAWLMTVEKHPKVPGLTKSVAQLDYDCAHKTQHYVVTSNYWSDGSVDTETDNPLIKAGPQRLLPGGSDYAIMEFVCAWKPK